MTIANLNLANLNLAEKLRVYTVSHTKTPYLTHGPHLTYDFPHPTKSI